MIFKLIGKGKYFVRNMSIDIGGMRKPYKDGQSTFEIKDLVAKEPFAQFKAWFDEASNCKVQKQARKRAKPSLGAR